MLITRRQFTKGLGITMGIAATPIKAREQTSADLILTAGESSNPIFVKEKQELLTNLWTFNQKSPGPMLRYNVGDRVKVNLQNKLPQETSIHWHGIRIKNSMDGVAGLTQAGVENGENFLYKFL